MPIPLTLGVPHRPDPNALVHELLLPRCSDAQALQTAPRGDEYGPPVVRASTLLAMPGSDDLGRIVVHLDVDPDELRSGRTGNYEAVRFDVDAPAEHLADALALRLPSPLVVFPVFDAIDVAETAEAVVFAHRTPGISAVDTPRRIADVLAVVSHADVGLVARADTGDQVLAILAATVASLRGDDIAGALAAPNVAALRALIPEAAEAVREVLLGIEIADAARARARLVEVGLIADRSAAT
ncbi:putative uncharacterized protein [Rhodococcus sp. AW25M09]|uniref:hypothetical protein n=1 Tax=Rhodococcus sp. AW25M09 TaxID=1268303 RepID=UPI0002AC106B|nr:hypothetical protein [Rhodococcus sp. AW25M09]CCQ14367.1 putative uncharacterized protein [Rhodococcus sp. AW25M09]